MVKNVYHNIYCARISATPQMFRQKLQPNQNQLTCWKAHVKTFTFPELPQLKISLRCHFHQNTFEAKKHEVTVNMLHCYMYVITIDDH